MSDKTMPITGGCRCGAVRYEATEPPTDVAYCHCRMCQHATGCPHGMAAIIPVKGFRFTRGAPKFYKSSAWAERGFCPECGSPLIFQDGTETHAVMIGSLDHPEDWPPTLRSGIESQIPWDVIHDDLPRMRSEEHSDYAAAKEAAGLGKE